MRLQGQRASARVTISFWYLAVFVAVNGRQRTLLTLSPHFADSFNHDATLPPATRQVLVRRGGSVV